MLAYKEQVRLGVELGGRELRRHDACTTVLSSSVTTVRVSVGARAQRSGPKGAVRGVPSRVPCCGRCRYVCREVVCTCGDVAGADQVRGVLPTGACSIQASRRHHH